MGDQYAKDFHEPLAPIAGAITVLNCNTTANNINLATCGVVSGTNMASAGLGVVPQLQGTTTGYMQKMVRFIATGNSVAVCFGPNVGAVTNNGAPNTANFGVNVLGGAVIIPANTPIDYWIHPDTMWMGYVATPGVATLTIHARSRGM